MRAKSVRARSTNAVDSAFAAGGGGAGAGTSSRRGPAAITAIAPARKSEISAELGRFTHLRIRCQCSTLGDKETLSNLLTRRSVTRHAAATIAEAPNWLLAARAAESKKAADLHVLDLREVTSFTDFFVICTASNPRQAHAAADEIEKQLKDFGELPISIEGYDAGEWVLMDYGDFIVHIFSETARAYYDLERLWRHAKTVDPAAT